MTDATRQFPAVSPDAGVIRQVLADAPELMGVSISFEEGAQGALHSHPHVQSTFVESGRFRFHLAGKEFEVVPGDSFVIPSNATHGICLAPPIRFESTLTEGACRKPLMLFVTSKRSKQPEAAAQIVNCTLTEPSGIDALRDTRGLPAEKCAADRLIDAGLIKPEIVRAHKPPMEASGPAISPFKEPPELRVAFIDALEENSCEMIGAEDAAGAIIDATNNVPEAFDS
ncbi:Cupin domain-containing protein [Salipiger thiooxidans]|uniref:Cupin domain-containing protein n=1 Tax=Salipiger thiooxidans TaxID=282683 RepID=A0A1G7J8T4_9RHOB|nr:Cupin domain-containing protein [Salipiger thiooxidans]